MSSAFSWSGGPNQPALQQQRGGAFGAGYGGGGGGPGHGPTSGMDRDSAIRWAVSRLTPDEARGKVALLSEELKQMKLMGQEIRLVKDALRKQQKEMAGLEREGEELQAEVAVEMGRRLELARQLEKAKSDFPLLDAKTYHLDPEDLEGKPLLPADGDELLTGDVPAPEPPPEASEGEGAAVAGAGAEAQVFAGEMKAGSDPVVDDLLSLIMGNTTVGAEIGVGAGVATLQPAPDPFASSLPVAVAPGGAAVQVRASEAETTTQSSVLVRAPVAVEPGVLSPFGSQIAPNLFKASGWQMGMTNGPPGSGGGGKGSRTVAELPPAPAPAPAPPSPFANLLGGS